MLQAAPAHTTTVTSSTVAAPIATMPASASGRALWAKAAMIESAKVWASAITVRSSASADDIEAALDECADIRDAFLSMAREFTDALGGRFDDLVPYVSDGIGDGLEWPLKQWLEDMGHEDANAEHRLSAAQLGVGRR